MKRKQNKTKIIISAVCILFWMGVIFSFTSQHGTESAGTSERVARVVVTAEERVLGRTYTEEHREARVASMQFPVRKAAHMTEYAILGILFFWHLGYYGISLKKCFLLSWLFLTVYAATDEFHQHFVPGRGPSIIDVGIDSLGGLIGLGLATLARKRYLKNQKAISQKEAHLN